MTPSEDARAEALVRSEGRPLTLAKVALTLDARLATAGGHSRFITGEAARRDVHALRAANDAVLVGVGTVLADDPALTVRFAPGRSPTRVVVDTWLRTPTDREVVRTAGDVPTLVAHGPGAPADRREELRANGVHLLEVPLSCGRVDPLALVRALAADGIRSLLVEGGAAMLRTFFARGLVDRVALYYAPVFVGGAPVHALDFGMVASRMDEAPRLRDVRVDVFDGDVRILGDMPRETGGGACSPA